VWQSFCHWRGRDRYSCSGPWRDRVRRSFCLADGEEKSIEICAAERNRFSFFPRASYDTMTRRTKLRCASFSGESELRDGFVEDIFAIGQDLKISRPQRMSFLPKAKKSRRKTRSNVCKKCPGDFFGRQNRSPWRRGSAETEFGRDQLKRRRVRSVPLAAVGTDSVRNIGREN